MAGTISSLNNGTRGLRRRVRRDRPLRLGETRSIDFDFELASRATTGTCTSRSATRTPRATPTRSRSSSSARRRRSPTTCAARRRRSASRTSIRRDPNDMQFIFSSLHQILNDDEETYGYVDAERKLESGRAQVDQVRRQVHRPRPRPAVQRARRTAASTCRSTRTPASAFAGGPTPGDFLDEHLGAGHAGRATGRSTRARSTSILFDQPATTPRLFYPQQSFSVDGEGERRLRDGQSRGRQLARQRRRALRAAPSRPRRATDRRRPARIAESRSATTTPISVDRTYDDCAAERELRVRSQRPARAAFCRRAVMARPDYTDVAPRVSLNPGALSGTAGNPNLDPYRANQCGRVARVVPRARTRWSRSAHLLQGHQVVHHRPAVHAELHRADGDVAVACSARRRASNLFNCPFTHQPRSTAVAARSRASSSRSRSRSAGGFGVQATTRTRTPRPTTAIRCRATRRTRTT